MPCKVSTEEGQSEYEFFQQELNHPHTDYCCGPLIPLGFVNPALSHFFHALMALGADYDYLDNFELALIDSKIVLVTMCSRHWFKHSGAIGTLAEKQNNGDWMEISYYIFKLVCLTNNWDYKEMTNYIQTLNSLREKQ
jgi:hypothetical protein